MTTARECAWAAASESAWLTIKAGVSGQGDGTVQFEAGSNPDPAVRRGVIVLNNQRAEITQAAGDCTITLAEDAASFDPAGGSGRVDVRASSALCTWTAVADADWITIRSGASGTGMAAVTFDVAATTGPPRTGGITIAGRRFTVTQSQGCSYSFNPTAYQTGPEGGTGNVAVTTTAGCAWTAASNVDWITVTAGGTNTSGPGTASFTVAPATGSARSATLTIAGLPFTVTQGQGCTYTLSPDNASVPATGGNVPIAVAAGAGCAWTAASNTSWIAITSGSQGTGNGTVQLNVSAATGPNRSGTATIAGRTFTVNQAGGCSSSLSSTSTNVPGEGGSGSVGVTTSAGCTWTAASNADWINITGGSRGTGNGNVSFTAAAHSGASRSGTLTIAGLTFTIDQAESCSYLVSPTQQNGAAGGETVTVSVDTSSGCRWTAAANASWISVPAGAGGTGDGTVQLTVAANSGGTRDGTATVAGRTVTINQASGCSYSLSPPSPPAPAGGGSGSVTVTAASGCAWTASSNAPWITISNGASGNGNGTVQYTAGANTGAERTGTLTIAGQSFTVTQAGGCLYSISPTSQTLPGRGGNGTVTVTAPAACSWTAATDVSWARVTAGASGTGGGTVQFTADPNPGPARTATFTIAGQTFTLTEEVDCTYIVAPETIARGSGATNEGVDVSAASGCAWTTTVNNASWVTITSGGTGSGNGRVEIAFSANTGPARSGTLTVATRTVTVSQELGCTYTLSDPPSHAAPTAGGPASVAVTSSAGCTWTATSQVSWITITSGASGSGDGTVQFLVEPNATGAQRPGAIIIGGQTFAVTQQ